ncbi:MAG: RodZ domain-containing protein [Pseudomonadota bacterium]
MKRRDKTPETAADEPLKGFDDFDISLGDVMRGERATLGKSLLDVQRDLKIKAAYIAAIENADPSAFESPGFVAGYVRSYARYLGLDPEWVYQSFCKEGGFEHDGGGLTAQAGKKGRRKSKTQSPIRDPFAQPSVSFIPVEGNRMAAIEPRALGSIAVMLALVCAIGYGGWSVLQEVQRVQFTPVEQTPGVLSQLDPVAPLADPGAEAGTELAELPAPSAEAFDRLYRPQALDVPVLTSRDGPIANIEPGSLGTLPPVASAPPGIDTASVESRPFTEPDEALSETLRDQIASTVQVVAAGPPEVALIAVRPSWVRVRSADGTVVFEKILDAGERFVVPPTEEPHTLRAGNAQSLYFMVGDQAYGPAGNGASVISDVALSAEALPEVYAVANPEEDADLARFTAVAEAQSE